MPGMGVGSETKVLRRMPIGDGVIVILMESSMSGKRQLAFWVE